MKKLFTLLLSLLIIAPALRAQTPNTGLTAQPYGKVDPADLAMTSCDFEKDANAEKLLDVGKFYYGDDLKSIIEEYHGRIKIFNASGNDYATIKLPFESFDHAEYITGVDAETINMVDGKAEVTKLEKKAIFTTVIDAESSEISFTFPNVKPGSVLEYKYKKVGNYNTYLPAWNFQADIPVRYSELAVQIPEVFYFRVAPHFNLPVVNHATSASSEVLKVMTHNVAVGGSSTSSDQESDSYPYNVNNETWGTANIPSLRLDDYSSSFTDNAQRINFDLVSTRPIGGTSMDHSDTWAKVGYDLSRDADFGEQLNRSLSGEQGILAKAALLKTNTEKIAFIFDTVKNAIKWNGHDRWYTVDGTSKAWEHKSGNATEINLIVYHLLNELNIEAYPMVMSTRNNGKADRYMTSLRQFNRAVVYIPFENGNYYVLDASGKYNSYTDQPQELLNGFGLFINYKKKTYDTLTIGNPAPVREVVLVNAEIKPGGKMDGTAQINAMSYDRVNALKKYMADGEQNYIKYLQGGDNGLTIASIKFENMGVDTLPLTQNIVFGLNLSGSDENYIYVNPNLFTPFKTNPFLSDTRNTDIYFGFLSDYSINCVYKIPAGYNVDALPKSTSMVMPDKSIVFKRIVAVQEGSILVHFVVDIKKKEFVVDEYPALHDFYKKMYEMLNEQIVLKKG